MAGQCEEQADIGRFEGRVLMHDTDKAGRAEYGRRGAVDKAAGTDDRGGDIARADGDGQSFAESTIGGRSGS